MEETYETPRFETGVFIDETCTDGEATSDDCRDSADSVVMGRRGGLEMHHSVPMGWTGALEMREREHQMGAIQENR